ncbi:hypothetical protein HPB48_003988 [Haemaphysalis longicornis]|uniref:RING-type domain-containing protein n=1 Tax=Haemaphysalis longicornis TaxID=44386 RepID=A0A9J6FY42_HAELO|nr:hypothetical protein HPB48_003988 [Haemaphysalis longicornis]
MPCAPPSRRVPANVASPGAVVLAVHRAPAAIMRPWIQGRLCDASVVGRPSVGSKPLCPWVPRRTIFGACSSNTGIASGSRPTWPRFRSSRTATRIARHPVGRNQPDMKARAGPSSAHQDPARSRLKGVSSGTPQAHQHVAQPGTARRPSRRFILAQTQFLRAFVVFARATDIPLGMLRSEIEELPAYRFNPGANDSGEVMCAVCLCHYRAQELVRILPGSHRFHAACVDRWVESNSRCPVCRTDALEAEPGASTRSCPATTHEHHTTPERMRIRKGQPPHLAYHPEAVYHEKKIKLY